MSDDKNQKKGDKSNKPTGARRKSVSTPKSLGDSGTPKQKKPGDKSGSTPKDPSPKKKFVKDDKLKVDHKLEKKDEKTDEVPSPKKKFEKDDKLKVDHKLEKKDEKSDEVPKMLSSDESTSSEGRIKPPSNVDTSACEYLCSSLLGFSLSGELMERNSGTNGYIVPLHISSLFRAVDLGEPEIFDKDEKEWKIYFDISQYKMHNISVSVLKNKMDITAKGKMDFIAKRSVNNGYGEETSELHQVISIPHNFDEKNITTELTKDGRLSIKMPILLQGEVKITKKVLNAEILA